LPSDGLRRFVWCGPLVTEKNVEGLLHVHELLEARDEKRLLRLERQVARYKLLIIEELGYVPLSQTGAELLFEIFSQRYERGSTIVTSNLPFDEWTSVFGSERLSARKSCLARALKQTAAPKVIQIIGIRNVSVVTPVTRIATQLMIMGYAIAGTARPKPG
jgi:IstB-like ATP binding protein